MNVNSSENSTLAMKLGLFAFVEVLIHKTSLNYENHRHEVLDVVKCDMGDTYDDAIFCEYSLEIPESRCNCRVLTCGFW